MSLRLAIVADDLTGALDTSAPFALAGRSVAVALSPEAIARALAGRPEILAVNTASRALDPAEAARLVRRAAAGFLGEAPAIIMKKIDSRLKGNIAAEVAALAEASGRRGAVVAPAAPEQGRFTRAGAVVGHGVSEPLDIAPRLSGAGLPCAVADAESDADLDALVAAADWSRDLAVGARGLGMALARSLAAPPASAADFPARTATLFAFASRDPITARQIERLARDHAEVAVSEAPDGAVSASATTPLPLVVRATGDGRADAAVVAVRFGRGVAALVERALPETLVMGGGDTALAILTQLGAKVLRPRGEAAPALPWFDIALPRGRQLRCVVKSGGFGAVDVLSGLLPAGGRSA
jgi:uncharacterized protein YgbK (DUF1537 family)